MAVKSDKRKKPWKAVLDRAHEVPANPLKPAALKARVRDEVRGRRLALAEGALEELIETVGQDLRRLMGELDKLEAFAERPQGAASPPTTCPPCWGGRSASPSTGCRTRSGSGSRRWCSASWSSCWTTASRP